MTQRLEGWGVRARPAAITLAVFVPVLVACLIAGGLWYRAAIAPDTRARITVHPSPALETIDTAPGDKEEPGPPAPPPGIARAMAETAAQGDALWGRP